MYLFYVHFMFSPFFKEIRYVPTNNLYYIKYIVFGIYILLICIHFVVLITKMLYYIFENLCRHISTFMMWCVVHFTLDDTVKVVPTQWFSKKEGKCAWPKTYKIREIKKAVINKIRPHKFDFHFYEARCLANDIGKYYHKLQ